MNLRDVAAIERLTGPVLVRVPKSTIPFDRDLLRGADGGSQSMASDGSR